jgi:hypothetical protein
MRLALPVLALLAVVAPVPAALAAPCAGGRFLVVDSPVIGAVSTPTEDAIQLEGASVTLYAGVGTCPATVAHLKRTKSGLRVRVRWVACPGVAGVVRLTARVDDKCRQMKGAVTAGVPRHKKTFVARQSRCGDGIVDTGAGEQCEPPDTASCSASCQELNCGDHCTCPAGRTSCDGTCVNLQSDPSNCGRCSARCVPAAHSMPTCSAGLCGSVCETNFSDCNHVPDDGCEANLLTDPLNCNACGTQCPGGDNASPACVDGACALKCAAGFGDCDGNPANGCELPIQDDPNNCGRCNRQCPTGDNATPVCTAGTCSILCSDPTLFACGHNCVDLDNDARNCGGCGNHCVPGAICANAACTCPSTRTSCPSACADLTSDATNCGACGNKCDPGEVCTNSHCVCPSDRRSCNGQCIDPLTDNKNCGGCGKLCGSGETCSGGNCVCAPGNKNCSGTCVNLDTNVRNCGECKNTCDTGDICSNGHCVCPSDRTVCSGACVDTDSSTGNCGHCGNICDPGDLCVSGRCVCPAFREICAGKCTDTDTDRRNCGKCGKVCDSGLNCVAGHCK